MFSNCEFLACAHVFVLYFIKHGHMYLYYIPLNTVTVKG